MSTEIKNYRDTLINEIRKIDTTDLSTKSAEGNDLRLNVIDEQKTYFWTRLFIKEEEPNIEPGDDVSIVWTRTGEKLSTKFICYGKQGSESDNGQQTSHYNTEDDKKVLCLLVDEKSINHNEDIPFIRTLFKMGRHFEYQLIKREELLFVIDKNDIVLDYYDTSF